MLNVEITYTDNNATKVSVPFKKHGSREEIETVLLNRYNIESNQIWKLNVSASSEDEALNALILKVDWEYLYDQGGYNIATIVNLPSVEMQIKTVWLHVNQNMTIEEAVSSATKGLCSLWDSEDALFEHWLLTNAISSTVADFIDEENVLGRIYPSKEILIGGQVIILNW